MTRLLSLLGGWQGYAAIALACFLAGSLGTWRVMSWKEDAAKTKQAQQQVRLVVHEGQIQAQLGVIYIPQFYAIIENTGRIQQEVSQHVTPQIDAQYPVPLGFVRVWNDASHGPIPGPSAGSDADPSGVPLSDVAHAHTADEGTLDQCRAMNTEWWDWYDRNKALWPK